MERRWPKIIMMQTKDDIFRSPAQTLVVPVNKVGVMGNGLALAFKQRVPGLFDAYRKQCGEWEGRLFLYEGVEKNYLCFATKDDWRYPSQLEMIAEGMVEFSTTYKELGITSVAFPGIGCGKGGLDWYYVLKAIMGHLVAIEDPELTVYLYPPY